MKEKSQQFERLNTIIPKPLKDLKFTGQGSHWQSLRMNRRHSGLLIKQAKPDSPSNLKRKSTIRIDQKRIDALKLDLNIEEYETEIFKSKVSKHMERKRQELIRQAELGNMDLYNRHPINPKNIRFKAFLPVERRINLLWHDVYKYLYVPYNIRGEKAAGEEETEGIFNRGIQGIESEQIRNAQAIRDQMDKINLDELLEYDYNQAPSIDKLKQMMMTSQNHQIDSLVSNENPEYEGANSKIEPEEEQAVVKFIDARPAKDKEKGDTEWEQFQGNNKFETVLLNSIGLKLAEKEKYHKVNDVDPLFQEAMKALKLKNSNFFSGKSWRDIRTGDRPRTEIRHRNLEKLSAEIRDKQNIYKKKVMSGRRISTRQGKRKISELGGGVNGDLKRCWSSKGTGEAYISHGAKSDRNSNPFSTHGFFSSRTNSMTLQSTECKSEDIPVKSFNLKEVRKQKTAQYIQRIPSVILEMKPKFKSGIKYEINRKKVAEQYNHFKNENIVEMNEGNDKSDGKKIKLVRDKGINLESRILTDIKRVVNLPKESHSTKNATIVKKIESRRGSANSNWATYLLSEEKRRLNSRNAIKSPRLYKSSSTNSINGNRKNSKYIYIYIYRCSKCDYN